MRFTVLAMVLAAGVTAAACVESSSVTDEVDVEVALDGGKADAVIETRVRAAGTTLWVRNEIVRETRAEGRDVLVVRGRTSREVLDGYAFVFDDVVGDWFKLGERTFEVIYSADDIGLQEGQNHFVSLTFAPSSGRPDSLTALVVAKLRLGGFSGSGMYLDAEPQRLVIDQQLVWRVRGTAASAMTGVRASAAGVELTGVRQLDATHFEIDLRREDWLALVGRNETLAVSVDLASGTKVKSARLGVRLTKLGLTDGDAYEEWPSN